MDVKNFAEVPKEEQIAFVNSFDRVLSDVDGVLWLFFVPIQDAQMCLQNLKKLGKSLSLITNYAFAPKTVTLERLTKNKFNFAEEDIITPYMAVIDYLKNIKFDKKIYAIASNSYKAQLKSEGFTLVEDPPQEIEENVAAVMSNIKDDKEVGAVIYDFDINVTFIKLQKALTYLKRKDCLFITGGADKRLPIGPMGPLLGNFYNYKGISELSGREPIQLAKPSKHYDKFIQKILNIKNPERVLFIGDVINEDMGYATLAGYKKLLVLSGGTKIDDVRNWKHPEEYKPDYYIENLTELNKILKMNHKL